MAENRTDGTPAGVDTSTAHPARVYDAWLGGKDNYAADREAAELAVAANPDIPLAVRANRAFLGRAVRYLAADAGIGQFLDIGTGIPAANNTHEVAQRAAGVPHRLCRQRPRRARARPRAAVQHAGGATGYLDADLRDVDAILAQAGRSWTWVPVALMLVAVLQVHLGRRRPVRHRHPAAGGAGTGSHLVVSHPASDIGADQVAESMRRYNERAPQQEQATPRTHAAVSRFFAGLEMLEPGGATARVAARPRVSSTRQLPMWCGVAKKP